MHYIEEVDSKDRFTSNCRDRDIHYWVPPAQIPACAITDRAPTSGV